jgi:hypothetical protein
MPFDGKPEQYTESQVKQDLRAALALLGPNGENWCQLHLFTTDGRKCALGAIMEVRSITDKRIDHASNALAEAIGQPAIGDFNDTHTFPEVRAVFEKAILIS